MKKRRAPRVSTNKKNPVNNKTCKETFTTMGGSTMGDPRDYGSMPNSVAIRLYYSSLGLLLLYILMRLFQKKE